MKLDNEDYIAAVRATCAPKRRPVREWLANWGGAIGVIIAWFALIAVFANARSCLGWLVGGAR